MIPLEAHMTGENLIARVAEAKSKEQLAECLNELLRGQEDPPSLRDLEQWGINQKRPLPTSTVHDVLRGVRPPRPHTLKSLLAACCVTDQHEVQTWLEALDRVEAGRENPRRRSKSEQELGPVSATRFFVEQDNLTDIQNLVTNAEEEVWLWGTPLSMHIPYLEPYLKKALAKGVLVKVLLIKPASAAMNMAAFRAPDNDVRNLEERLSINLNILRRLGAHNSGLEIRLVDYLAPYTLYAYDPGLGGGKMDLRLGSFLGDHDLRPTFQLLRARDGDWFDYFYEQFTLVWSAAAREPALS
ncbi:hypothetical protein ACFYXH_13460 [Streptomyces sp. NPDC002730]|uniref:hypothetical protein n=1 Tax=Streptomyces sp. NPDC002730 TaxID=3364662 RepID=UPI0036B849CC